MNILKLSIWIFTLCFAIDASLGEIENGYAKTSADPKVLKISVIDSDTARNLFRKFAQDKDIPFRYPIDGCYARATEMARIAEANNIQMGKIYAEGALQVKTDSVKYPLVKWGWHVAPISYVKQADGKIQLMVFDPSLFSKPVTVQEWKNKMLYKTDDFKAEVFEIYYSSRFQFFPRDAEDYKNVWEAKDLKITQDTFKDYLPLQDLTVPFPALPGKQQTNGVK